MISSLIFLAVSQAKTFDVHVGGLTMPKVMESLSTTFGERYSSVPFFKDKVLLIDATGVTQDELRIHVAKTLNADWEKGDDGWRLVKSKKRVQEDVDRLVRARLKFLTQTVGLRTDSLKGKEAYSAELAASTYHQMLNEEKKRDPNVMQPPGPTAAGYNTPNQRFMSRFLIKFGLDRIAAIPNGHRVVFSLHPNKVQEPMGIDVAAELKTYFDEFATWKKTTDALINDPETKGKSGGIDEVRHLSSSQDIPYTLQANFGMLAPDGIDLLFSVYCGEDGVYMMNLKSIPRQDAPTYASDISSSTYEGAFAGLTSQDLEMKPDPDFKLSQKAQDFRSLFYSEIERPPGDKLKALRAEFADPTKEEPLSFGLAESLVYDTRKLKKNVVAILDDSSLNIFEPMFGQVFTNPKFDSVFGDFFRKDGRWIEMPELPFRENNFPRYDLKSIVAGVRQHQAVDLFDRARIAAIRPRTNAVSYIERYVDAFANATQHGFGEVDALKIIGMLDESEKEQVFRPEGIPYARLKPELQRHLFECCFYNQQNRMWPTKPGTREQNVMLNEPTLLAPNGIPQNAVLRITRKDEEKVKDVPGDGAINMMEIIDNWGAMAYQLDHPAEFPSGNFKFDRKHRLQRVNSSTYQINFQVSENLAWSSTLTNTSAGSSDTFTLDSLPADLKERFDQGYKSMAEAMARQRKRSGGGGQHFPR